MPNDVAQLLKVEGPDAYERMRAYFTDFDQTDDLSKRREQWRGFDFGKIIPKPAILDQVVENGSDRYIPFLMNLPDAYLAWERLRQEKWSQLKARPLPPWQGYPSMRDGWMETHLRQTFGDEPIDNARLIIRCFAETGHKSWYDWSIANWGTKWNAYSSDSDPDGAGDSCRIKFQSAWDCPEPVLTRLVQLNPDLWFTYAAFSEHTEFYATGQGRDGRFVLSKERPGFARTPEAAADFFAVYGTTLEEYDAEIASYDAEDEQRLRIGAGCGKQRTRE